MTAVCQTTKRLRAQELPEKEKPPPFLEDLPDESSGMVLSEMECQGLLAGGRVILRAFNTSHDDLLAVLRKGSAYHLVGRILLGTKSELGKVAVEDLVSPMYSRETAAALLKNSKTLWKWNVQNMFPFSPQVPLPWMDNRFRNRVFKVDVKQALATFSPEVQGPTRLVLADTASYMFEHWSPERQQALLDILDSLKGAPLRVGTTCSGSDVCISVLKQTLAHFAATKVWLKKNYIYIYIFFFGYIIYMIYVSDRFLPIQIRVIRLFWPFEINLHAPLQGISVTVSHVFSVELHEEKRAFILKEHQDLQHCFANVSCFKDERAFCYVCQREHAITPHNCSIDLLVSGPSCKDLSKLKSNRGDFVGCYEMDGPPGTSGPTYQFGFRKVPWKQVIDVFYCKYIYIYMCVFGNFIIYIYLYLYNI